MNQRFRRYIKLLLIHTCIFFSCTCFAQCPPNIGFELGSFAYWECSAGSISAADGSIKLNGSAPITGRHTLLQNTSHPLLDIYGGFPVSCPNGSGYSIQLGNSGTGRQAERVSYTFTIPSDQNNYSIIYNYAVVFQNPAHADWEQPKFTANVFDVSNGSYIGCSSFSYAASSNLPGFKQSVFKDSVFYKTWTPVTIKLSGYAGKTIRLEFTTNDCTRDGHFGYAYIDVNENCASPISGNVFCLSDTAQTLTAPFGFAAYRWFNNDFSKLLGTDITLNFKPVSPPNTVYAVEVTPYPEQGCVDTVYTTIHASADTIHLNVPIAPIVACISNGVDLTSGRISGESSAGLSFAYYTDPSQTNYVATPKFVTTSGTYYIKATNNVGCTAVKPVTIKVYTYPDYSLTAGVQPVTRPASFDLNSLIIGNTAGIVFTYWKDSLTTIPLSKPEAINTTGTYYIKGTNQGGCFLVRSVSVVVNEPVLIPPNAFSPNGDGVNDLWEIPLLSLYPDCTVEIYNRLGQLMFRSVGYASPWDGKYKGIDQAVATYYYIIKPSPLLAPIGGSVTIVR